MERDLETTANAQASAPSEAAREPAINLAEGDASATADYVAPLLLSLSFACFLFVCILFKFRSGGIEEKEESTIFALGWATIPAATLLGARYGGRFIARAVDGNPFFRSLALIAHAVYWYVFVSSLHWRFPGGTAPAGIDPLGPPLLAQIERYLLGNAVLIALGALLKRPGSFLNRAPRAASRIRAVVDACLPFAIGAMGVAFSTRTAPPWAPWIVALLLGTTAFLRADPDRPPPNWAAHLLVLVGITLLVYNPVPDIDRESHNYYLGPVASVLGGKTLLVDINCQYGVGVIYFIAGLMKWHVIAASMTGFAHLITSWYVLYYFLLYWLFLVATRSFRASAATLFLLILVCNFAPRDFPTFYPSVGPVRFFWGYLFLGSLALRARYPRWRRSAAVIECASLGLASIWSFESFVYVAAAFIGVVFFDSVTAVDRAALFARWRRIVPVVGAVLAAHLVLAVCTFVRSGSWPHWSRYFAYIALYTKGGFGQLLITTWTPWVFVIGIYLVSVLAFGYRRFVLGLRAVRTEDALVFGATALGITQFTYFLGRSHPNNLFHIAPPAVFIAVAWSSWAMRAGRLEGASRWFRSSVAFALVSAGFFLAFTCVGDFLQKYDHSLLSFITSPREVTPVPFDKRAIDAQLLVHQHSSHQPRVLIVTSPDAEVEAYLGLGRADVWPVSYAPQDALLASRVAEAQAAPLPLTENDIVYLDVSGSPNDRKLHRGDVTDSPSLGHDVNPFERALFNKLHAHYSFQVVDQTDSGMMAARLVAKR